MNPFDGLFTRYVGRMFATRFIALLVFFVIILQMLDMLNKSSEILAATGADWRSIVRYIALRGPQIASQFTPFAVLLGIVATLVALNQRSEVTVMRSAGMSVQKVLFPIGVSCLAIALAHFVLHETFVVRTFERLAYWESNNFAVDMIGEPGARTNIRLAHDGEIVSAGGAARFGEVVRLNNVSIYNLDNAGLATNVIEADAAYFTNGGWRLEDVTLLGEGRARAERLQEAPWTTTLRPEQLFAAALNPDRTALPALVSQIGELTGGGVERRSALTALLSRFSKPLASLAMPLLGAIAGFGVARAGTQLARAAVGASLGFAYFVVENLMIALGKLGAVPAVFGSFFAFALFMLVGFAILLAMDN